MECWRWPELSLEELFQMLLMSGNLKTLLVIHQDGHPVLIRKLAGGQELRESRLGRGDGKIGDVELGQDGSGVLHEVGPFTLHHHALSEQIPHGSVLIG